MSFSEEATVKTYVIPDEDFYGAPMDVNLKPTKLPTCEVHVLSPNLCNVITELFRKADGDGLADEVEPVSTYDVLEVLSGCIINATTFSKELFLLLDERPTEDADLILKVMWGIVLKRFSSDTMKTFADAFEVFVNVQLAKNRLHNSLGIFPNAEESLESMRFEAVTQFFEHTKAKTKKIDWVKIQRPLEIETVLCDLENTTANVQKHEKVYILNCIEKSRRFLKKVLMNTKYVIDHNMKVESKRDDDHGVNYETARWIHRILCQREKLVELSHFDDLVSSLQDHFRELKKYVIGVHSTSFALCHILANNLIPEEFLPLLQCYFKHKRC